MRPLASHRAPCVPPSACCALPRAPRSSRACRKSSPCSRSGCDRRSSPRRLRRSSASPRIGRAPERTSFPFLDLKLRDHAEVPRIVGHERRALAQSVRCDQQLHVPDRRARALQGGPGSRVVPRDRLRPVEDREALEEALHELRELWPPRLLGAEAQLSGGHDGDAKLLGVSLEALDERRRSALDDIARDVRIEHPKRHSGSRCCGGESRRSRKSSGTSASSAKKDTQSGFRGERTRLSPCLRMRTSFTSSGKRSSCGRRTAWFLPLRKIAARREAEVDIRRAAVLAFDSFLRFGFEGGFMRVRSTWVSVKHMPYICSGQYRGLRPGLLRLRCAIRRVISPGPRGEEVDVHDGIARRIAKPARRRNLSHRRTVVSRWRQRETTWVEPARGAGATGCDGS